MCSKFIEVIDTFTIKGPVIVKVSKDKTIHCSHACRVEQFFNCLLIVRLRTDTGPQSFRFEEEESEVKWAITQCQILDQAVLQIDNADIFSTVETPKITIYRKSQLTGSFTLPSLKLFVFDCSSVIGDQITISECNLTMEGRHPILKGLIIEKAVICTFVGGVDADISTFDSCLVVHPSPSYDQAWYLIIRNQRTGDIKYQLFPSSQEILRKKLASQARQILQAL